MDAPPDRDLHVLQWLDTGVRWVVIDLVLYVPKNVFGLVFFKSQLPSGLPAVAAPFTDRHVVLWVFLNIKRVDVNSKNRWFENDSHSDIKALYNLAQ